MAMAEFRSEWDGMTEYKEKMANNIVEEVLGIGKSGEYELIVVGKGRFPSNMVAQLAEVQAEQAELGPIGDILASSGHEVVSSVLVIQQHDMAHAEEAPVTKIVHTDHNQHGHHICHESSTSSSVTEISKDIV